MNKSRGNLIIYFVFQTIEYNGAHRHIVTRPGRHGVEVSAPFFLLGPECAELRFQLHSFSFFIRVTMFSACVTRDQFDPALRVPEIRSKMADAVPVIE